MLVLTASTLLTPTEQVARPLLFLEEGKVAAIGSRDSQPIPSGAHVHDYGDAILAPALIDMHIHGSGGYDVMVHDESALPAIEGFLAMHGVGSYFPTTVTAPRDILLSALDRLAGGIERCETESPSALRARPLGIHLEGPFISRVRRGVHPPENLVQPSLAAFEEFWQAARGRIRVLTIAPEIEGALEVIVEAERRGVCVSLGHSDADLHAARKAVDFGARHATHTFNAMRPLDHRDPGILGQVLTDARMTADIIADGVHLDPAIVKLFMDAKGDDGAVLITDAIAATGMPNGHYRLGSLDVEVLDGKCTSGGKLAGSVLTLDRAVINVMKFAGWNLQRTLRAATLNPARAVNCSRSKGRLAPGMDADIVVLSPGGEVLKTILGGMVN